MEGGVERWKQRKTETEGKEFTAKNAMHAGKGEREKEEKKGVGSETESNRMKGY